MVLSLCSQRLPIPVHPPLVGNIILNLVGDTIKRSMVSIMGTMSRYEAVRYLSFLCGEAELFHIDTRGLKTVYHDSINTKDIGMDADQV